MFAGFGGVSVTLYKLIGALYFVGLFKPREILQTPHRFKAPATAIFWRSQGGDGSCPRNRLTIATTIIWVAQLALIFSYYNYTRPKQFS